MTIEVRLEALPRSSQVGGGDVADPTWPAREVSADLGVEIGVVALQLVLRLGFALREFFIGQPLARAELRRPLEGHAQFRLARPGALRDPVRPTACAAR